MPHTSKEGLKNAYAIAAGFLWSGLSGTMLSLPTLVLVSPNAAHCLGAVSSIFALAGTAGVVVSGHGGGGSVPGKNKPFIASLATSSLGILYMASYLANVTPK